MHIFYESELMVHEENADPTGVGRCPSEAG